MTERVFRLLLYNNKDDNDTIFISFPCFEEKERERERKCDDRHRYERNRKRMNKNKVVHKLLVYDGADKQLSGQRLNDRIHTKTSFFFNILLVTFVIYLRLFLLHV
jgi:hypothetical protein